MLKLPRACVVSIINAVFRFKMFQTGDALWNEVPIYALWQVLDFRPYSGYEFLTNDNR